MKNTPNILFFFTDDQRFDTLHALGNEQIKTPNLDQLVAAGTTFTHAFIPGGTCGAVCMPSRAMLHTGRSLFHLEGEGQDIPLNHHTMGETLQSAGYNCFATGKWHNGRSAFARSFNQGDEIFFGGMADHWNVPAYHYDPRGQYSKECAFIQDPFFSNEKQFQQCDHITPGKHSTELFADTAINFLQNDSSDQPFFLYVSLMAPHDPRTMPQKFLDMYPPESIQLPENFLAQHPIDTGALRIRDEMLADLPRQTEEIRRHIAEYYAMISHLDFEFGRLIAELKATGEYENTIIIFAGDNGLALGQHGLMGKQNLYDHSVRVPLIFAGPGIAAKTQCDTMVYLFDIFPTICGLLGLDVPDSVDGSSLLPCLESAASPMRDSVYLAYADTIRGVRDKSFKLIEYAGGETQLFDLKNDSLEKRNLAEVPEYQNTVSELRRKLCDYCSEWDDANHTTGARFWASRSDLG